MRRLTRFLCLGCKQLNKWSHSGRQWTQTAKSRVASQTISPALGECPALTVPAHIFLWVTPRPEPGAPVDFVVCFVARRSAPRQAITPTDSVNCLAQRAALWQGKTKVRPWQDLTLKAAARSKGEGFGQTLAVSPAATVLRSSSYPYRCLSPWPLCLPSMSTKFLHHPLCFWGINPSIMGVVELQVARSAKANAEDQPC